VVTVESGGDLVENDPTFTQTWNRDCSTSFRSKVIVVAELVVTLATPGIAADSTVSSTGWADHAENSFSVDGTPIYGSAEQSVSNQIPLDSVQSLGLSPAHHRQIWRKSQRRDQRYNPFGQGVTEPMVP